MATVYVNTRFPNYCFLCSKELASGVFLFSFKIKRKEKEVLLPDKEITTKPFRVFMLEVFHNFLF